MRGYLVLAIFALSIGSALQQNYSDVTNLCRNNTNRGVLNGRYPGLSVLDTPTINASYCGNEFAVYGTCCNLTIFNNTINQTRTSANQSIAFLKTQYAQFVSAVGEIYNFINNIANNGVNDTNSVPGQQRAKAQALLADPFMGKYLANHNASLITEFNIATDTCWPLAQRIRESALCIHCSGRTNWFQADASGSGRLTLNHTSCPYDQCRFGYEKIIAFIQDLDYLFNFLPSLYTAFGINNNFALVVNRALVSQYAERFQDANFYLLVQQANGGNAAARDAICSSILSSGAPLLIENIGTIFTRQANFSLGSIQSAINPNENIIINEHAALSHIAQNLSATKENFSIPASTSSSLPNSSYDVSNVTVPLPPNPPITTINRRRLQGVNNTYPGDLGVIIVSHNDYTDELVRVTALLSDISSRTNSIRSNFIDAPSPNFSVAGRAMGGNNLALTGFPLTFKTQAESLAFVAGKPFGEIKPYDNPTSTTVPDWLVLRISPNLRFWTPTTIVATA